MKVPGTPSNVTPFFSAKKSSNGMSKNSRIAGSSSPFKTNDFENSGCSSKSMSWNPMTEPNQSKKLFWTQGKAWYFKVIRLHRNNSV